MRTLPALLSSVILSLAFSTPVQATELSGTASHYGGTAGFIGQATVALPGALGGHYTGHVNEYVQVCADRCATLPVVDFCQCYWGTTAERIVDLSDQAWLKISNQPLSRGLIQVTLTTSAPPNVSTRLPNTASATGPSTLLSFIRSTIGQRLLSAFDGMADLGDTSTSGGRFNHGGRAWWVVTSTG